MDIIVFKVIILFSLGLFFISKKSQYCSTLLLQLAIIGVTSYWAIEAFCSVNTLQIPFMHLAQQQVSLTIDKLSAFFILVINFTVLTGIIYAKGYLAPYGPQKSKQEMAFHFFNFFWLHVSMLLVVMFRDVLAFLVIWELMSLSSFFLVIFDSQKKETLKTGINYLIQMHVGVVFLMGAFFISTGGTKGQFNFDNLLLYFSNHNPFAVFILFFIGFGIKAGFIPLHSWLPHAHPAAPSHVSGVMSGVMIKLGIYGILRVLTYIHHDLLHIGIFILIMSLVSGILGVLMAIVQHDVKKLLAYHSIENIGIIGVGIGLGVIGIAVDIPALTVLGFAGGILHILNHSLFKSLLFYTSGAVYSQTHTRNIEQLGGLIKKMPKTALFFLLGALAICGLPPFNGFISEFLIYSGIFKSLHAGDLFVDVLLLLSFTGLAVIGGLAIFCFTKVFSIIFLGSPRSDAILHAKEVERSMIISDVFIGVMIIMIGFFPILFMKPLSGVVQVFTANTQAINSIIPTLNSISITSGIFIMVIGLIWVLRAWQQKRQVITNAATWGCAYQGAKASVHQYTATSYADSLRSLTPHIVSVKKEFIEFEEDEIFPQTRSFATHSNDVFEENLVTKPGRTALAFFKRIAVFQTGKIQHYLFYALAFLVVIFLLTLLKWI